MIQSCIVGFANKLHSVYKIKVLIFCHFPSKCLNSLKNHKLKTPLSFKLKGSTSNTLVS